jgi:hypothetical protein
MPSTDADRRVTIGAAVGCVMFALPLLAHAYAGTASRYLGDDYCAGYIFRDYGFIGGQVWHYNSWSAVPTTLLLMAMADPGGVRLAPVLPAAAVALWIAAAAWAVRQLSIWSGWAWSWLVSLYLAEILIFVTLQDAPNVEQSLYLRVPMLAYTCPLIILTLYVGMVAHAMNRERTSTRAIVTSAVVAFAFGGFGPVCAACLAVALPVTALFALRALSGAPRRRLLILLAVGFAGAVVALAAVALAPGNATRQARFPHPPDVLKVAVWSVAYTTFMFSRSLVPFIGGAISAAAPHVLGATPRWLSTALEMGTSPIPVITAVVLPAVLMQFAPASTRSHAKWWPLWWIPAAAFIVVCACMAPGAYGTSAPPPPRALIIPQYLMTCLASCWGFAAGARFRLRGATEQLSPVLIAVTACLLVVAPAAATPRIVASGRALRQWAFTWDRTDRQIRAAHEQGMLDAVVPAVDTIAGVGSISPDAGNWVNICAAKFYGLRSITGTK